MKTYRIPEPRFISIPTHYGAAYCWECNHNSLGLRTLGDTKLEAQLDFIESVESEYPGQYKPATARGI